MFNCKFQMHANVYLLQEKLLANLDEDQQNDAGFTGGDEVSHVLYCVRYCSGKTNSSLFTLFGLCELALYSLYVLNTTTNNNNTNSAVYMSQM